MWKKSGLAHRPDGKGFDLVIEEEPQWTEHNKQSGITESILCKDCEGRRGALESYMGRQIYDELGILRSPQSRHRIVEGLSYKKVKLFSMFNLFMMGISKHPYYAAVSLGRGMKKNFAGCCELAIQESRGNISRFVFVCGWTANLLKA